MSLMGQNPVPARCRPERLRGIWALPFDADRRDNDDSRRARPRPRTAIPVPSPEAA